MTTTDDLRAAQDEIARLREVMGLLGMTGPLSGTGPGAQPDPDATEREITRICGLPPEVPASTQDEEQADREDGGDARGAVRPITGLRDPATARTSRRRRWPVMVTGVAAAALLAVGASVLPHLGTEPAVASASPPMLALPITAADLALGEGEPARDALLALADVAGAQADPDPAGEVQHVLSQSWLMSTEVVDAGSSTTIDPTVVESWLAPDGSMVSDEWRGPELDADGLLDAVDTSPDAAAEDQFAAGTFDPDAVTALSDDPAVLRDQLLDRLPGIDCTGDAEPSCLYLALTDLSDRYVMPAATEAALWAMLADTPGVTVAGEVTDRAGRQALAVAVPGSATDSSEVVRVLLIDTASGRLSGREEVTISSEALGITEPTVTLFHYTVASGRVAEVGGLAASG